MDGGGIYFLNTAATVSNCILWADLGEGLPSEISVIGSEPITVTYSDVQGGWPGTGNINMNPFFVGPDDVHLSALSACINIADPAGAAPVFPAVDIDGDLRPQGTRYDMGADEFVGIPATGPTPDIKANHLNGIIDVTPSTPVTLSVGLSPGDFTGVNVDLWIIIVAGGTPYVLFSGQYPLASLRETNLITGTLPAGTYSIFFVIDDVPDGRFGYRWFDYVTVRSR